VLVCLCACVIEPQMWWCPWHILLVLSLCMFNLPQRAAALDDHTYRDMVTAKAELVAKTNGGVMDRKMLESPMLELFTTGNSVYAQQAREWLKSLREEGSEGKGVRT
jgi:hypothetical protein